MSDPGESDPDFSRGVAGPPGYALSGKIMLSAIIILFFVVVLMVVLHLYARWYLLRARRRRFLRRNRHNRRTNLVFYVDPAATSAASRGLDAAVLKTLPLFAYSGAGREPHECAVCLSEFEENETGRLLPKCSHSFHIDCIDMWFQSHSTCPLCRSPVEAVLVNENQAESPAAGPNSFPALRSTCQHDESRVGPAGPSGAVTAPSLGGRQKPSDLASVSIEVPRRSELEDELAAESPATQFRSPVSRMLSFRRILSRERRGSVSPSSASCAASEADLERGREETQQTHGHGQCKLESAVDSVDAAAPSRGNR